MKKHWLIGTALIALSAATSSWAADNSPADSSSTAPSKSTYHEWTLEEARQHAHEKADKLDKMTEAEWAEKQAKHHAWYDKWKKMTPEEKAAYKKQRAEKRKQKMQQGAAGTASPSAAVPATPIDTSPVPKATGGN